MILAQVGIAVCGVTAIWLSQDKREAWRRWACIFGLAGQPFWIAETIHARQWGILALCALYTWSWWRGFRGYWLKREEAA
jgi:hypothetical protein